MSQAVDKNPEPEIKDKPALSLKLNLESKKLTIPDSKPHSEPPSELHDRVLAPLPRDQHRGDHRGNQCSLDPWLQGGKTCAIATNFHARQHGDQQGDVLLLSQGALVDQHRGDHQASQTKESRAGKRKIPEEVPDHDSEIKNKFLKYSKENPSTSSTSKTKMAGVSSTELTLGTQTQHKPNPQPTNVKQANLAKKIDYFKRLEKHKTTTIESKTNNKTNNKELKQENKQNSGKGGMEKAAKPGKIEKFLVKLENGSQQQQAGQEKQTTTTTGTKNQQQQQHEQSLKEKIRKFSSRSPPKIPTNPMMINKNNNTTQTKTTRETTTLMEMIKQKQKRKQQQQQQEKNKTKTRIKSTPNDPATKSQLLNKNPNTETGSPRNDIRLYFAKNIGKPEAEAAAFPPATQLGCPPPPTQIPPTAPQLSFHPSRDGASASCKNISTRGTLETERQTKPDDAAKGDTGCTEMRQHL